MLADLSLRWTHKSFCRFCNAAARFSISHRHHPIITALSMISLYVMEFKVIDFIYHLSITTKSS